MIVQYSYGENVYANKNNNVIDLMKKWHADEIRASLDSNRTGLVNICQNLTSDFNKGTVIRTNNAFLGKAVYIVGKKKYNTSGAVGTTHIEHVFHADTFDEVIELLHEDGYKVFAVDNIQEYNPVNIFDADIPYKSAFVYGEEQRGLSEDVIEKCDGMVFIGQNGSVRSLNVGCAAAIIMAEYSRRYRL